MTRKSVKFSAALRRTPWKSNLGRREADDKNGSRSIFISSSCAERWSNLRVKFKFSSDSELVDYLLTLGESQPKPSPSLDYDSDNRWCPSDRIERKKRGPSLRAVLRRSTRKSSSRSELLPESIESDEVLTDESSQSEGETRISKKFASKSSQKRSLFVEDCDSPAKKQYDSQSMSQRILNRNDDEEVKANQLDAELALLVKSVDIEPSKQIEHELYEFKEDLLSDTVVSRSSFTSENSNTVSKVSHRRWKSYHKDKRKWKQSYAAVSTSDRQLLKVNLKDEACPGRKSEKERKTFKSLKKNRILTAYLDSQNKIADNPIKESSCPPGEEDEVLSKEVNDKSDAETVVSNNKRVVNIDDDDNENGRGQEEASETQALEDKNFNGKENQSKSLAVAEPMIVEGCERGKLKRKRKKGIQDSDESSPKLPGEHFEGNTSNVDRERHHRKSKRNWKKSIVNYEFEDKEPCFKSKNTVMDFSMSDPILSSETINTVQLIASRSVEGEIGTILQEEDIKDMSNQMGQDSEGPEQESNSNQSKQCIQCQLRHFEQTCPVEHPFHVVGDSMTFEQWQLQCQVQVRCSVIEAPRSKTGRLKKLVPGSPPTIDNDRKNRDTPNTRPEESARMFAEESLPAGLAFEIVDEKHGKSVIAHTPIRQYTQFGPLVGPSVPEKDIPDESDMRHIWEVWDGNHASYINTEDLQKSNWLRFIRPAPEKDQRNITVTVQNNKIYFVSVSDIPQGHELLYWADDHVTSWSKKKILKSSCGGCNMRFAHPLYYRTHCAIFHDPLHSLTIRKYHCKVCGESVMGKENIMKHAADLHEGRGAYQCQYCHKFFLRLNYLEMHRTYGCKFNPHRTRPLCDFCGRYFCQPQKLKVHIKRMHSDMNEVLREFQCKSCLKILGSRAALQRHFKEVHHRDVVLSNCDRCGKSFQNRSNLKIHMLTHSGVKPFRCQQEGCSAAFTTKQCLQFHYKKAHGLSEDALPRIERSIAYTFDAYAGETADNSGKFKETVMRSHKILRRGRTSTSSQRIQSQENMLKTQDETAEVGSVVSQEKQPSESFHGSGPVQVNQPVESQQYKAATESMSISNVSLPENFAEPGTMHENALSPSSVVHNLRYGDEARELESKVLTPLRTVTLHSTSDNYPPHVTPVMMPCTSPCQSPQDHLDTSPSQDLRSMISLENKGHKRWLGEVIEVAEEAAAAAMRLSPRLSPHLKRDIYDFDENKVKSKQYLDATGRPDMSVDASGGRSKTAIALAPFHHAESASMLVEAALDAAERDICRPSSMIDSSSPVRHSPEPMQVPPPSYCIRSPGQDGPSNTAYYSSQPSSLSITDDRYHLSHSPGSQQHLHHIDSYSVPPHMSPPRLYSVPNHQMQLLPPQGPLSSDDECGLDSDCNSRGECAQNLSLNLKAKVNDGSNTSAMYSAPPPQHSELIIRSPSYQDHDPLPQQNDLSFSGTVLVSPPRYRLYDLSSDRQRLDATGSDLSIVSRSLPQDYSSYDDIGGSMDLSVPRGHASNDHSVPSEYNSSLTHQYAPSHCVPNYSTHPSAYQNPPLQRSHISSSSSTSPSGSSSPGPTHYHQYPPYY